MAASKGGQVELERARGFDQGAGPLMLAWHTHRCRFSQGTKRVGSPPRPLGPLLRGSVPFLALATIGAACLRASPSAIPATSPSLIFRRPTWRRAADYPALGAALQTHVLAGAKLVGHDVLGLARRQAQPVDSRCVRKPMAASSD